METRLQSGARVTPAGDTARQFVIERIHAQSGMTDEWLAYLPFVVWVYSATKPARMNCGCAQVWRISEESLDEWSRLTKQQQPLGVRAFACDCIGHFIE